MGKFSQLDLNFDIQEMNWIRWCLRGEYEHRRALFWGDSITGKLMERMVQFSESASDSVIPVYELDAIQFNKLVGSQAHRLKPNTGLPDQHRAVYIAYVFNKIRKGGKLSYTKAGDAHHQCSSLGITRHRYDYLLKTAIELMKRRGGLV